MDRCAKPDNTLADAVWGLLDPMASSGPTGPALQALSELMKVGVLRAWHVCAAEREQQGAPWGCMHGPTTA